MKVNVATPVDRVQPSLEEDRVPGLEATAAARAARLGKTVDQLLVDDRLSLRTSAYPTAECFRPHEVEQYARGDLSEARIQHAYTCQPCAALLVAAQSWERPLDVFLDEVRNYKPPLVTGDVRASLTDVVFAAGPIIAVGLLMLVVVARKWDAIMSISFAPLGWTPAVILLVVTVLTVAAIPLGFTAAKKLGLQASFGRSGGAAVAGVFGLIFVGYGAFTIWTVTSNYQRVQSAQDMALGIIATKLLHGSNDSQAIKVPAATGTLTGSIIAEPRKDSISEVRGGQPVQRTISEAVDIYWGKGQWNNSGNQGSLQNVGTAYVGYMEQQPDGTWTVRTSGQMIGVNVSSAQLLRINHNEPVFALVPANAHDASRVLSVEELSVQTSDVGGAAR